MFKTATFTPELQKTASKRMSRNASEWSKQALEYFYDQYPQAMGQPIHIQFKEKEPDKGYAVGSIRLGPFSIPVLINNYLLAPNDIAIRQDGIITPFNKEVVELTMSSKTPFMQIQAKPKDIDSYGTFDRALSYAGDAPDSSLTKSSSVLDRLAKAGVITEEGKTKIAETLASDPLIELSYKQNNAAMNILAKLAGIKVKNKAVYEGDLHYIHKTGNCEYEMIVGSSIVDDAQVVKLGEEEIEGIPTFKTVPMEKTAAKFVNLRKKGSLLPLEDGNSLFIRPDGEYTKLAGHLTVSDGSFDTVAIPTKGDHGILAVKDSDGNYTGISDPFSVIKVAAEDGANMLTITGHSNLELKEFKVLRVNGDKLTPDIEKNAYYVPGNSVFIKLGNWIAPEQMVPDTNEGVHRVFCHGGDNYTWKSPVLAKYAANHNLGDGMHTKTETLWALIQAGADSDTIEKVASLGMDKEYVIPNKLRNLPLVSNFEEPEAVDNTYWTKLAAWAPEERSIDAILSLNFLKKDSMVEFIEQIPLFEETAHNLAKLLLGVRLGLRNIDEAPLVEAVQALSKIILMLHGAKNVGKLTK